MVKRVAIYSLPEGADVEEFWKYHTQVHAVDVLGLAGLALKKYVINRVTKVESGEQKFFGLVEMWWENEETMKKAFKTIKTTKLPNGKSVPEDFWSRVINGFSAAVEEFVVKE